MSTNYRALCAELVAAFNSYYHFTDAETTTAWQRAERVNQAITAADAALKAESEGKGPSERIASIAKAVQECAFAHESDARLIGNVCAEDVADLCNAVLARWTRPATPPAPEPARPSEWEWRDIGDGKPVQVRRCHKCGVCPSNVDDCGHFGDSCCPYFGIDAMAALPAPEPLTQPAGMSGLTWEAAINGLREVLTDQTDDDSLRVAMIKAECALADIAEGEETNSAPNTLDWAERRCAEALADIRPVMKLHQLRTSE
jgi:hypothetical protein